MTTLAPYASVFQYGGNQVDPGTPLTSNDPLMQALIGSGAIYQNTQNYSNEGGSGTLTTNNIDWSNPALPPLGPPGVGQKYGNWISAGPDPYDLINPNAVYNDPNYGPVTPAHNFKVNQKNAYDYIGPAFAALLTMGAGALAAAPVAAGAAVGEAGALTAGEAAALGASEAGGGLYGTSVPWQFQAVRAIPALAQVHWSEVLGGKPEAPKAAPATTTQPQQGGFPSDYNPGLYGNLGSMAAPANNDASPVMSSLVPGAYDASQNHNYVVS